MMTTYESICRSMFFPILQREGETVLEHQNPGKPLSISRLDIDVGNSSSADELLDVICTAVDPNRRANYAKISWDGLVDFLVDFSVEQERPWVIFVFRGIRSIRLQYPELYLMLCQGLMWAHSRILDPRLKTRRAAPLAIRFLLT